MMKTVSHSGYQGMMMIGGHQTLVLLVPWYYQMMMIVGEERMMIGGEEELHESTLIAACHISPLSLVWESPLIILSVIFVLVFIQIIVLAAFWSFLVWLLIWIVSLLVVDKSCLLVTRLREERGLCLESRWWSKEGVWLGEGEEE